MLFLGGLGILGGLIESAFFSLKSFFDEVRSRLDEAREIDIVILGLAYNVARLATRGIV